jgi:hypothetical protein
MSALDYAAPQARPSARRSSSGDVLGWLSVAAFGVVVVCFIVGLVGVVFDPAVNEPDSWAALPYLFLMALPTLFLCPLGLLAGVFGIVRGSGLAWVAFLLNAASLIVFFLWRNSNH